MSNATATQTIALTAAKTAYGKLLDSQEATAAANLAVEEAKATRNASRDAEDLARFQLRTARAELTTSEVETLNAYTERHDELRAVFNSQRDARARYAQVIDRIAGRAK